VRRLPSQLNRTVEVLKRAHSADQMGCGGRRDYQRQHVVGMCTEDSGRANASLREFPLQQQQRPRSQLQVDVLSQSVGGAIGLNRCATPITGKHVCIRELRPQRAVIRIVLNRRAIGHRRLSVLLLRDELVACPDRFSFRRLGCRSTGHKTQQGD
jgi:hypothetical protein